MPERERTAQRHAGNQATASRAESTSTEKRVCDMTKVIDIVELPRLDRVPPEFVEDLKRLGASERVIRAAEGKGEERPSEPTFGGRLCFWKGGK
jgi:hypothetical protein